MKEKKFRYTYLLVAILAVGFFLRIYKLDSIPPGFYLDEGVSGLCALDVLENRERPIYFDRLWGVDAMYPYLTALSFSLFGPSVWSIRLVAALGGTLAILGIFLLAKELFSYEVGIFAAMFLALSRWHINFSRIGFQGIILSPLLNVFAFYWLFRGLRTKKVSDFFLSGLTFGLGLYTHFSFRLIPVVLFFFLLYKVLSDKGFFKGYYRLLGSFILPVVILILPLAIYFLQHPGLFLARPSTVAELKTKEIFSNIIKVALMFGFKGDLNARHNIPGEAMLFFPVFVCFFGGFLLGSYRLLKSRGREYFFLFLWFFVMLMASVFSAAAPHASRNLGTTLPISIFSGLFVFEIYKIGRRNFGKLMTLALVIFFVWVGYRDFDSYFNRWAKSPQVMHAFGISNLQIFEELNRLAPRPTIFLSPSLYAFPSITFLIRARKIDFRCLYNYDSLIFPMKPAKEILYVYSVHSEEERGVAELVKSIYPKGKVKGEIKIGNIVLYELYEVKSEHLHPSLPVSEELKIETVFSRVRKRYKMISWIKDQLSFCAEKRKYSEEVKNGKN